MTDSLTGQQPADLAENPEIKKIEAIRNDLHTLLNVQSISLKRADVTEHYNRLAEQVEKLNDVQVNRPGEQNQVDTLLEDCFHLVSLLFLAVGRKNEAPAIYSAVWTANRLLDHLKEAAFYLNQDLVDISMHLQKWEKLIEDAHKEHSEALLKLLRARIDACKTTLKSLQDYLSKLDPEMMKTYEKLVSILRSLSACNCRSKYPRETVDELYEQLVEIQKQLHETVDSHEGSTAEEVYTKRLSGLNLSEQPNDGRSVVASLLARCFLWVEIMESKKGEIDQRFKDTYKKMEGTRNKLEQLDLTSAWTLRVTELYQYQCELDLADKARVNGNFVDSEGRPADLHAQRTLLYLLRKSYVCVYRSVVAWGPVSEPLLPIYHQLQKFKDLLVTVQLDGGVSSEYIGALSLKLNGFENLKRNGKFMIGNSIPEGEDTVSALLAECYELAFKQYKAEREQRLGHAPEGNLSGEVHSS